MEDRRGCWRPSPPLAVEAVEIMWECAGMDGVPMSSQRKEFMSSEKRVDIALDHRCQSVGNVVGLEVATSDAKR